MSDDENKTTITVNRSVRDVLRSCKRSHETYDSQLLRLVIEGEDELPEHLDREGIGRMRDRLLGNSAKMETPTTSKTTTD